MKKFIFDANKAQKALENLENDTLKGMSGDLVKGGEWRLTIFGKKAPKKQVN